MIIKKLEIDGFGKFNSVAFDFDKGVNLVYGNNEDGKTTLMSFVKMMLYSSSAKTEKSADLFKALRKKYRPWSGAPMSGAMEFESGGMTYRLQKEFLKSDATDKTTVFCITTGENVQIENKNDPGEYFLGMSLDEFERSIFMGQGGGFSADTAADSLAMRISNLSVSGDENVSHSQVTKRLTDALEELVSKSRKKGLLVEAEQRLDELKEEKHRLVALENEQKTAEADILKLSGEIRLLEEDLGTLSGLDRLENAKKDLNAFYTLQNKLNLLKVLGGQLAVYDTDRERMEKYIKSAAELNLEIEDRLTTIQEATLRKDTDISDEDYAYLDKLDKKSDGVRKDLENVRGRITTLWNELEKHTHAALKGAKLGAVSILIATLVLAAACFSLPFGAFAGLCTAVLGIGLFLVLFFTADKRALTKVAVQLCKRDYEAAVRELFCFDEKYLAKSPNELELFLGSILADSVSALSNKLEELGIQDMEQLRKNSPVVSAEKIKAITNELAQLKESFITISSTIKPCPTYSAAKILYVELCESLAKEKSVKQEIDTICRATGIENIDEEFVSGKIKDLGNIIKDAPIAPSQEALSPDSIRQALDEKRAALGRLQAEIKRPRCTVSELLSEIKVQREIVDALKRRYEEISIAIEVMNEAISDTNRGLGSQLSQKVSNYILEISGGAYRDVLVPRDLNLEARSKNSQAFREWKYLSTGAIDKVYLCLRLAMTDVLAESHGAVPLFLDDIFSQYDDQSTATALRFLKKYIEETNSVSQLIFFTCHKNIFDMAKKIFADSRDIIL